jgi:hypothetical protein
VVPAQRLCSGSLRSGSREMVGTRIRRDGCR